MAAERRALWALLTIVLLTSSMIILGHENQLAAVTEATKLLRTMPIDTRKHTHKVSAPVDITMPGDWTKNFDFDHIGPPTVYRSRALQQEGGSGSRVLGLGIGTVVIIVFIFIAGLICFYGSFTDTPVICCCAATFVMLIVLAVLFSAPREAIDELERQEQYSTVERNVHSLVRYGIGITLFISSLAACVCLCIDHGIEKIQGKLIEDPIRPSGRQHIF